MSCCTSLLVSDKSLRACNHMPLSSEGILIWNKQPMLTCKLGAWTVTFSLKRKTKRLMIIHRTSWRIPPLLLLPWSLRISKIPVAVLNNFWCAIAQSQYFQATGLRPPPILPEYFSMTPNCSEIFLADFAKAVGLSRNALYAIWLP